MLEQQKKWHFLFDDFTSTVFRSHYDKVQETWSCHGSLCQFLLTHHTILKLCRLLFLEFPVWKFKMYIQGILALCEFYYYCEFHYCNFSKLSKYLANLKPLMQYLASFISLLRNKENCSYEIISPKIVLGKYLANAKFS